MLSTLHHKIDICSKLRIDSSDQGGKYVKTIYVKIQTWQLQSRGGAFIITFKKCHAFFNASTGDLG